jgi:hypothetical protein
VTCVDSLDTDDGEYDTSPGSMFSSSNDIRSGRDPLDCSFEVLIGRFTSSRVMQSCQPTCPSCNTAYFTLVYTIKSCLLFNNTLARKHNNITWPAFDSWHKEDFWFSNDRY